MKRKIMGVSIGTIAILLAYAVFKIYVTTTLSPQDDHLPDQLLKTVILADVSLPANNHNDF